jgi:hypothetical protein
MAQRTLHPRQFLRCWRIHAVVLAVSCLCGCAVSRSDPYPEGWAPTEPGVSGQCPVIAGRYVNNGAVSAELSAYCGRNASRKYPQTNAWSCDSRLSANLGQPNRSASPGWIEIQQPDSDSIRISIPDDDSVVPWVLKHSAGDFECDGSTVKISKLGSSYSSYRSPAANAFITTGVALTHLSGGIVSSSLSFRRVAEGTLVMDVRDQDVGAFVLLFWYAKTTTGYVKWDAYGPPASVPAASAR